jgi:transglutaminase/protease-like cytokinesis protein 3
MEVTTDVKKLTDHDVLTILQDTTCFACGGRKNKMRSHCPKCYYALTPESRQALYRRFGDGYSEAYVASLNELDIEAELVETVFKEASDDEL